MRVRILVPLFFLTTVLLAHPGVGIVGDRRGNIYYTDLVHVWRITPSGERTIVVRDVHTHALALDTADNLYGEDSQYLGGDRWSRKMWRRTPEGVVTITVPWHTAYPQQHGITRDPAGATYWVESSDRKTSHIFRRRPGRAIERVAPGARFGFPMNWLALTANGSIYVADGVDLKKVDPQGRTTMFVRRLARTGQNHALGGLFVAQNGDVYAAVAADRLTARVTPQGEVSLFDRSPATWTPWGVFVDARGAVWILEYGPGERVQVRRKAS